MNFYLLPGRRMYELSPSAGEIRVRILRVSGRNGLAGGSGSRRLLLNFERVGRRRVIQLFFCIPREVEGGRKRRCISTRTCSLRRAAMLKACWGFARMTGFFSVSKLFFAYGLGNGMYFPLSAGASMVLNSEKTRVERVAELVARHRPTIFFGVPTFYAALLQEVTRGLALRFVVGAFGGFCWRASSRGSVQRNFASGSGSRFLMGSVRRRCCTFLFRIGRDTRGLERVGCLWLIMRCESPTMTANRNRRMKLGISL